MVSVKLVKAVVRSGDGMLVVNDGSGNTIADTFLARGWKISDRDRFAQDP